ncbi:GSCFA domain-containing protein [Ancylomarina longa]|uniref:GSCFA domain protein n=1 Tax=Ancylomarina longa TaxID=2487017 RepID=A0A434AG19_9BACT|nr:GSCFA domain-containing protein [Ancylomarina longa]RUT73319.1 GSCFA domain protein [Ancylomarina longa]
MEIFRTVVDIPESPEKLSYHSSLFLMGSCFAENIGKILAENKFNLSINPFGVIYNPISVGNSLKILMEGKVFTQEDLNLSNDLWFSYAHHGKFSNLDADICLENINSQMQKASLELANADILFLTFGTSWVYELLETGEIVSNCHKQSSKLFHRYRLDVDEIVKLYKELIVSLSLYNPSLKIIFTISPIRHWKDGAHGNQLSKATLLLAVDQLVQLFDQVSYFPSYEIVMDELRDYRFYADDMIHTNTLTEKYIWSRFVDTYMEKDTLTLMKKVKKIISAANHRPFNPDSESHQQFITKVLLDMSDLENQFPSIVFDLERSRMRKNLLI